MVIAGGHASVVVVGAGPRSTGLLAALRDERAVLPSAVVVVDAVAPDGAGSVWRADQSPLLLANTRAREIGFGPAVSSARPSFRSEPGGAEFPSRVAVGGYLRAVHDEVRASLAARCPIAPVRGRVRRVVVREDGGTSIELEGGALTADCVVFATGGDAREPVATGPDGEPTSVEAVPGGAIARVRGLGLTFHDVVVRLTVGRGGRHAGDRYVPNGEEPLLLCGSRTGVPVPPKPLLVGRPLAVSPAALSECQDRLAAASGVPAKRAAALIAVEHALERVDPAVSGLLLAALRAPDGRPFDAVGHVDALVAHSATRAYADAVATTAALLDAMAARRQDADGIGALEAIASRATSGPPAFRFRQLRALVRGGVVAFEGRGTRRSSGAARTWRIDAWSPAAPDPATFATGTITGGGWPRGVGGRVAVDPLTGRVRGADGVFVLGEGADHPFDGNLPRLSRTRQRDEENRRVAAALCARVSLVQERRRRDRSVGALL